MNRSKLMFQGPTLPDRVKYPCILDIEKDVYFMIGPPLQSTNKTIAYLFNQSNSNWTSVGRNYPCPVSEATHNIFSCSYLSHEKVIITTVNDCIAGYEIGLSKWSLISLDLEHGLVFNEDIEQKSVIYIGSDKKRNGSHIYYVSLR